MKDHGSPGEARIQSRDATNADIASQWRAFLTAAHSINIELAAVFLLLFLVNIPLWGNRVLPVSDARNTFCSFHFYYSHFFKDGEFPLWLPYGAYGVDAALIQVRDLSLPGYFVGFVGGLFHVSNTLRLFKISLLMEQFVLVFGVYLLGRRLYSSRLTTFLVSCGAALSTVWYVQVPFNLRFFYCLPLAMYLLLVFLQEKKAYCLWLAGFVSLAALPGMSQYFLAVYLFVLFCWFVFLAPPYRCSIRSLFQRDWRNLAALGATIALGLLLSDAMVSSLTDLKFYAEGRDPVTAKNTLRCFLTYPWTIGPHWFAEFLPGGTVMGELTLYIGVLPWLVLPLGFFSERRTLFLSFIFAALMLFLLSAAGTFAALAYYFPLLAFYRHLPLIVVITKILFLLAAGFGLDVLWQRVAAFCNQDRNLSRETVILAICVAWLLLDSACVRHFRAWLLDTPLPLAPWHIQINSGGTLTCVTHMPSVVASVLVYPLALLAWWRMRPDRRRSPRVICGLVAAVWLIDMLAFQNGAYCCRPRTTKPGCFVASGIEYCPQRVPAVRGPGPAERLEALAQFPTTVHPIFYTYWLNVVPADPPMPPWRVDFISSGVDRLIALRGGKPKLHPDKEFLPPADKAPALWRVFGCTCPKVRIVSKAEFVEDQEALEAALARISDLDQTVVFMAPEGEDSEPTSSTSQSPPETKPGDSQAEPTVAVREFNANTIRIEAHAGATNPGWLVYADAWHPGWHATVNGEPAPVLAAYGAFKAVKLKPGLNDVQFRFHHGVHSAFLRALPLVGIVVSLAFLVCVFRVIFSKREDAPPVSQESSDSQR